MNTRTIIEDAVAFLLVGVVFPIGLQAFATANMTGVDSSVKTIFQILLPIIAIIGVAVDFLRRGKSK